MTNRAWHVACRTLSPIRSDHERRATSDVRRGYHT